MKYCWNLINQINKIELAHHRTDFGLVYFHFQCFVLGQDQHTLVEIEGAGEVLFSFLCFVQDPHTLVEIEGGGPIWHQAASNMWGCSSASHYMGRSGWEGGGGAPSWNIIHATSELLSAHCGHVAHQYILFHGHNTILLLHSKTTTT